MGQNVSTRSLVPKLSVNMFSTCYNVKVIELFENQYKGCWVTGQKMRTQYCGKTSKLKLACCSSVKSSTLFFQDCTFLPKLIFNANFLNSYAPLGVVSNFGPSQYPFDTFYPLRILCCE